MSYNIHKDESDNKKHVEITERIKIISSGPMILKRGEKASPKIVKQLFCKPKADTTIFYLGDSSSKLAYIHAKTDSKFLEFERVKALKNDIGLFPEVRYINSNTREVVVEWIEGKQLGYFDKPKEKQPVVTDSLMNDILKAIVGLHKTTSQKFNPLEVAPRALKNAVVDDMLLHKDSYFNLLVEWYRRVYDSLNIGRNMNNLDILFLDKVSKLVRSGEEYLSAHIKNIAMPPSFSLLHGDLHPENILKTRNGVRLIDFEYIHFGDRAAEMAYFFEQGSQSGYIDDSNREQILMKYLHLLEKNAGVLDPSFSDRFNLMEVYTTYKFLGLLCGGYTSSEKNKVNEVLLEDVYQRAIKLGNRLRV